MSLFKTITQGGQVHLHQLRMLRQILVASFLGAFLTGSGYFAWKCTQVPYYVWQGSYEITWARTILASTPETMHKDLSQVYTPFKGKPYQRKCLSIARDPYFNRIRQFLVQFMRENAFKSLYVGGCTFFCILLFWFMVGRLQKRPHHKRGNTLIPPNQLKRLIKQNEEASNLSFGKLPLLKDKETSHILITGTTGSGKTNAFRTLLPQIRKRKDRAIVLDLTGDYVSRYYDATTDVILNPLDTRSQAWHPWADCQLDFHYDVFAEAIIQSPENSKDPFWQNASRYVLKTALRKYAYQKNTNIEDLYNFLTSATDKEFEAFFKETEAATYAFKNNDKTTHSIRSVLSSHIESLRQLDASNEVFSIRNWVMDDAQKGWLFMTARPDQRASLRPLISAWMDMAMNALMTLPPHGKNHLWFIIDELPALQRLPGLQLALAEARKYGGCFLVGAQSKPQLEDIYGRSTSEAMLDLFNTKIFFRCTEPSTQAWISKVLGDKEEEETQENISFGAHHMRDGVSLSRPLRRTPLIMPAELSQLQNLECYIKYPGDYPCTKMKTPYQNVSIRTEAFCLKPEKERVYEENLTPPPECGKEELI